MYATNDSASNRSRRTSFKQVDIHDWRVKVDTTKAMLSIIVVNQVPKRYHSVIKLVELYCPDIVITEKK